MLESECCSLLYFLPVQGDRVLLLLLLEEELVDEDFLVYLSEFITSGHSISHLFTYEGQTTITNSIRTEVTQAGLTYTRDVAWNFFLRYFTVDLMPSYERCPGFLCP